jgi:hypothetical protein
MRVITGICVVLALAASGCTQAAEPTTLPEPTASTTAGDAVSGLATTDPSAEGQPQSTSDPLGFLSTYMRAVEESVHSEDALQERRAMFAPTCSVCEAGADVAAQILDTNLTVLGGEVDYNASILPADGSITLLSVSYSITPIRLLDQNGEQVQSAPSTGPLEQIFQLGRQEDGTWKVLTIEDLG